MIESRILSRTQEATLRRGNICNASDLLLTPINELARKCRTSAFEIKTLQEAVCRSQVHCIRRLKDLEYMGEEKFTSGDAVFDQVLGGGFRTGMVWEIAGESAAGKTQLGLQLSLLVQLPPELGGLSGSSCYLTTSSSLPTPRLLQISEVHPLLSPSLCSLSHVHTTKVPTIPTLIQVLSTLLPGLIAGCASSPRPVKLLVIDALAELFHSSDKTTTTTLVERSRNISEISAFLHSLAAAHRIAIVVLNEVIDSFQRQTDSDMENMELVYTAQSRWFNKANSIPGEDRKEVCLGLVWANQVNARILLSRTGRRRYLEPINDLSNKHRRVSESDQMQSSFVQGANDQQPTLIRRLTAIFSSVSPPVSLDYVITAAGFSTLSPGDTTPQADVQFIALEADSLTPAKETPITDGPQDSQLTSLDVGLAEDSAQEAEDDEDDEWEKYCDEDTISDFYYNAK